MSNARRISKKNISVIRPLESLEDRRLMTTSAWDNILIYDTPANTLTESSPSNNTAYSIRALINYWLMLACRVVTGISVTCF